VTEPSWRTDLSEAEQHQIREAIAAATAHDGVAPVGDQVLRELSRNRTRHLVAEADGVVGYLNLVPGEAEVPAMAEAFVHPEARRRGTGAALVRAGLAAGGPGARVWAHGNGPAAKATAASLDLVVARELWQLRRSLDGLPAAPVVPGIELRTYRGPEDDAELLRVNNAAFSWHPEQGGWTEADIAERRAESWFDPDGLFLAFDGDRLLGFHWTKVHDAGLGGQERSDSGNGLGEVYVVGVDPEAQGRGLGGLLTLVGLHHLAAVLGPGTTATLYVEANNSAAVNTYQRLGFELFNADVAYTTG
jgi:mycothiol synthase